MFNIVLFEPEIPPNTGNIIRLCANTGASLHLIEPLGFQWSDKKLRRAGLDYREFAQVSLHQSFQEYLQSSKSNRLFACSTRGSKRYSEVSYLPGDSFVFGPETRGLPVDVLSEFSSENILHLPMLAQSRSLNLSNSVAIFLYEAWRQNDFLGHSRK